MIWSPRSVPGTIPGYISAFFVRSHGTPFFFAVNKGRRGWVEAAAGSKPPGPGSGSEGAPAVVAAATPAARATTNAPAAGVSAAGLGSTRVIRSKCYSKIESVIFAEMGRGPAPNDNWRSGCCLDALFVSRA
jgi:hypothetical protein